MKKLRYGLIVGALVALCTISAGATWLGVGTVNGNEVRLRAEASTSSSTLGSANKGATLAVLEQTEDGAWYKVDLGTQMGYMYAQYVDVVSEVDADLGWGIVTTAGSNLNMRSGPSTEAEQLASIPKGKAVKVTGVVDGWLKITYGGREGYVSSDYITLAQDENGTRKDAEETASQASGESTAMSSVAAKIVANAKAQLGKPYVWGAAGPRSFDCSGFTNYVAKISGFSIPRGATSQFRGNSGTKITSIADLQPGDFVYICNPAYANGYPISHTMIYLGNNQIIHADSTKGCISIKSFQNYKKYFKGAWRLG